MREKLQLEEQVNEMFLELWMQRLPETIARPDDGGILWEAHGKRKSKINEGKETAERRMKTQ